MIVDRPLEKQSGRNEQSHNTDTTEELRADAVFERPFGLRKRLGKVRWQEVFCAGSCSETGRRRGLSGARGGLSAQLSQLPLQRFDPGGQGGKLRGDSSFLGWLPLLLVRNHGNYFTAILRRSGTELCQLIVFALRKKVTMPVRVLVVDDDALSREVLALLLNSAGYAAEAVDSGDSALRHLQTTRLLPDVVLADLQMPGTSGDELARQLRDLCGPATTLLAMSATEPDDGSDREFDGFLQKPFTMETFAAAIAGGNGQRERIRSNAADLDEAVYAQACRVDATLTVGAALCALPYGCGEAPCEDAAGGIQW